MIDDSSDEVHRSRPRETSFATLAALGTVAAAGLTAYLVWPVRGSSASSRKHEALIAYLHDHLSGSDVAIRVVQRLGSTQQGTVEGMLFRGLSEEIEEDRAVVRSILTRLGASARSVKRVAGYASGAALSMAAGGEPGDLSLLRTFEALSIGVQGKRCLWRALQNLRPVPSAFQDIDFGKLEERAVRQWEAIEVRRCALAQRTFSAISG